MDDSRPPVIGEHHLHGFRAGAARFSIRTNVEELATIFADRFRDLHVDEHHDATGSGAPHVDTHEVVFDVVRHDDSANPWGVWRDGEPCETSLTESYVLVHVVWEINRLVVDSLEQATSDIVAVHAASAVRDGTALIFPGPSHAGKSTLVGWLVAHGWRYVTDELSIVDAATMTVSPYRRPIGVRPGGPLQPFVDPPPGSFQSYGGDEWLVPASIIGDGLLADTSPVVAIVFPTYTPGASPAMAPLTGAEALVKLTEQAPTRLSGGRTTFRRLSAIAVALPAWDLVYDDLDCVSSLLEPLLQRSATR